MALPVVYSNVHLKHKSPGEFLGGSWIPSWEKPERVLRILELLSSEAGDAPIDLVPPTQHGRDVILKVHAPDYVSFLESIHAAWVAKGHPPDSAFYPDTFAFRGFNFGGKQQKPAELVAQGGWYSYDNSTPVMAHSFEAILDAADVALTGADLILAGASAVYSLCRPPGHHAGPTYSGGYCYLNNAAIAAVHLRDAAHPLPPSKVAILDIDFHHGNGTQDIFYESADVQYVSIHADPNREYPYFSGHESETGTGAGQGFTLNIPLPPAVTLAQYLPALDRAMDAITSFAPKYLVVSVGIDTYEKDPIGDFGLNVAAYKPIGERIAAAGIPTLLVHEGGYCIDDMPDCVANLLGAFRS